MGWARAKCVEEEKYKRVYWCGNLKEIYRLEFLDICGRRYYEMDRKEQNGLAQTLLI
jgi:hypothetical protein